MGNLGHELIEMSVPSELNKAPYAFWLEEHVKGLKKIWGTCLDGSFMV